MSLVLLGQVAAITLLATLLGWTVSSISKRSGINDAPDGVRKTQDHPIPRLGGIAILIAAGLALLPANFIQGLAFSDSADAMKWAILASFCSCVTVLGLWDDIWTANTKLKLALLAAATLGAAWFGLHPDSLTTPFGNLTAPAALILGSALWLLVFTNAANFMDGSNGLSIGCMAIMLAGLAIAGTLSGDFNLSLWWFALFGAIAGFLIHNLRGTLYAGDAGALGLGALFASLGLVSSLEVWTVATLALPFLIDVLLTLVWRARHKRSWLNAHRDHAYQRLIDTGWSHMDVAFLYWGMSIACAVAAVIAAKSGGAAPFAVFWALTLMGTVLWCFNRSEVRPE